ncbi:MAG: lipocalin-like domain-containing protein [Candidatus Zhuqueibacterota bacterium]
MKRILLFLALILILFLIASLLLMKQDRTELKTHFDVTDILGESVTAGFEKADIVREFSFPRDHGPHPDFQSEWWYFTGNAANPAGERFGFQFTLFRSALTPDSLRRTSAWATNQIYMAHFTVTDAAANRFYFFERFSRGAPGLAGAQAQPFRIWLENWSAHSGSADFIDSTTTLQIDCEADPVRASLTLTNKKPVALHGNRGLSQKGEDAGNASYYYSLTRLAVRGEIAIDEKQHPVVGSAWLDREWSTSALGQDQVGWDWFSLQLDNGWDVMFYRIRRRDGSIDRFSHGTLIDPKGRYRPLSLRQVALDVLDYWDSPGSARYPSGWRLRVPDAQLDVTVTPLIKNQELNATIRYWEGAVRVQGSQAGAPLQGHGYVELTGYSHL